MIKKYKEFINESLIVEKSTLSILGVPSEVMKPIQKDLAIPNNVEWEKISTKREITDLLKDGEKNLFIQITLRSIKIIVCQPTIDEIKYFVDNYKFVSDDWGGGYEKQKREYKTLTQTLIDITPKSNLYRLNGEFSTLKQSGRKKLKKQIEFNEFNEKFKKEFVKKFDGILKRITGTHFREASGQVSDKIKQIALQNKYLIQGLDNPLEGPNGLSILDEFLLKFEDDYSEYFGERVDLKELIEYFTRDKVMTLLMYYIQKGKIKE